MHDTPPHATATAHAQDALDLLTSDHKIVLQMFDEFRSMEDSGDIAGKGELVKRICRELTVHAEIEEEIFYPTARDATGDDRMVDDAEDDHANAKALIAQLESMQPGEPDYDASVNLLRNEVERHVTEEQEVMFPRLHRAGVDTVELGERLMQRKQMLQEELSGVKPS